MGIFWMIILMEKHNENYQLNQYWKFCSDENIWYYKNKGYSYFLESIPSDPHYFITLTDISIMLTENQNQTLEGFI